MTWRVARGRRLRLLLGGSSRDGLEMVRLRAEVSALREDVRAIAKLQKQHLRALEKARQTPFERQQDSHRLFEILQRLYDDEPGNRRRLAGLRASPDYEFAFTEPTPAVSVILPTYSNVEGLVTRAVPSVLAQTYENFELLVVGDGAGKEVGDALAVFDDPRVVYVNRERRGPYPSDPDAFARVKGGPPFNVGVRVARGRWIAPFADDDAMRPRHLELLVQRAREGRHEFVYGQALKTARDGTTRVAGEWPPELARVALQASIYHRGLSSFIEHELVDGLFRTSSDKSVLRRMLHAGVRFGFVEEIVVDYAWRRATAGREAT